MGSGDHGRQRDALAALERGADAALVPTIAPLAETSRDAEVRAGALRVLARIGGREAVGSLLRIAEDPHRTPEVVEVLAGLGERDVAWVGEGLEHPDTAVRCAVIEALGRMGHSSASALLASALRGGDEATRAAALYALGRLDVQAARVLGTPTATG